MINMRYEELSEGDGYKSLQYKEGKIAIQDEQGRVYESVEQAGTKAWRCERNHAFTWGRGKNVSRAGGK